MTYIGTATFFFFLTVRHCIVYILTASCNAFDGDRHFFMDLISDPVWACWRKYELWTCSKGFVCFWQQGVPHSSTFFFQFMLERVVFIFLAAWRGNRQCSVPAIRNWANIRSGSSNTISVELRQLRLAYAWIQWRKKAMKRENCHCPYADYNVSKWQRYCASNMGTDQISD